MAVFSRFGGCGGGEIRDVERGARGGVSRRVSEPGGAGFKRYPAVCFEPGGVPGADRGVRRRRRQGQAEPVDHAVVLRNRRPDRGAGGVQVRGHEL